MDYVVNPGTNPHYNMAFDEALLCSPASESPVFCLWQNQPSVIIGLNQSAYAEVNLPYLEANGIVLARRVTGGGAVYHDLGNLNYTITGGIREMDEEACLQLVVETLRSLGVPAEKTGRNDILVEGRKCSGYAKRMEKDRIMIHGTLMFDVDLATLTEALAVPGSKLSAAGIASVRSRVANLKEYLPQFESIDQFQAALQAHLSGNDSEIDLSPEWLSAVQGLADEKFSTWEWNFGHSPAAEFQLRRKFPCGTVEARFSLKHGCLDGVSFGGDFLGNLPASELAERLQDVPFRPEELEAALRDASSYFDRLSTRELVGFLLGR
jgi:lipoate-protein ligase A